jgi:hypothetical protein
LLKGNGFGRVAPPRVLGWLWLTGYAVGVSWCHSKSPSSAIQTSVKPDAPILPASNRTNRSRQLQSGDKWRTETYDAAALPDEFEKVMLIIGERLET